MTTPLSLPRARQLAGLAAAAHIPHDVARMACVELGRACVELEQLRARLAEARATIARLNRRCQRAEGIVARAGIVATREQGAHGRSLGRALANYAAARLATIAAAALDGWDRAVSLRPDTPEEREELWRTLDALTGEGGRATIAAMATPLPTLSSLAAVAYAACRAPSSPVWERLDAPTQARIAGRLLYGLDYLAGGEGMAKGVIYEASPTDPLPVLPEP